MENGTMRRSGRVLLIVLAVLVVLAGAGAAVVLRLDTRAKEQHEMLSRAILARETWLSDTRVRLTENGAELGSYTLEDLGLAESARSYITVGLTQVDLLPQEEFEALGLRERISWSLGGRGSAQNVTLDAASLDTAKPEADANRVERTAPQDARVSFEDGKFTLQAETGGNTLRDGAVHDAIAQALTGVVNMGQEPQTIEAELTDIDCYEVPEITEENTAFDMQESFEDALDGFALTINFEKAAPQLNFETPTQTISQEQAQALVMLNADGTVMVDEAGVRALVDSWAAIYDIPNTKYQFKSEVDGYVPIQFLDVSYKVDCDALTKELAAQLLTTVAACMINNVAPTVEEAINEVDRVARTATADALAAEEQEVVQKRVALKYFGAAAMNQYTLFSFTSNMLLFRLNHSSCHAHGAPVEALQLAVVKPKLLYRRSLDCHELSLYGSINLNAVNLMSLLLMPLVQKFDVYAS